MKYIKLFENFEHLTKSVWIILTEDEKYIHTPNEGTFPSFDNVSTIFPETFHTSTWKSEKDALQWIDDIINYNKPGFLSDLGKRLDKSELMKLKAVEYFTGVMKKDKLNL